MAYTGRKEICDKWGLVRDPFIRGFRLLRDAVGFGIIVSLFRGLDNDSLLQSVGLGNILLTVYWTGYTELRKIENV